jgi:hypothetical protein
MDVLNEHSDNRVPSNRFHELFRYEWSWPPHPPDLNPWGFLKDTVYKNKLHKIEELKKENSAAGIRISEETLIALREISDISSK